MLVKWKEVERWRKSESHRGEGNPEPYREKGGEGNKGAQIGGGLEKERTRDRATPVLSSLPELDHGGGAVLHGAHVDVTGIHVHGAHENLGVHLDAVERLPAHRRRRVEDEDDVSLGAAAWRSEEDGEGGQRINRQRTSSPSLVLVDLSV